MKIITNPPLRRWERLAQRPALRQEKLVKTVKKIFSEIQKKGDKAVLKYSTKFDYPSQTAFPVEKEIIDKSSDALSERLKRSIDLAKRNIEIFHHTQWEEIRKVETIPGVVCWRESRPIEKVGIYVPGGSAPLFSTVLMLAIPAKIAGCKEIILCTPPNGYGEIHPAILYTANLTGVTRVFAVGGIQAIGAMTFGTESIPKVDKIFGPGNQYVTTAKMVASLYGTAIDMPAGPSEVLVVADETCNPSFVAADLLSQAEHGPDSQVILLSNNKKILKDPRIKLQLFEAVDLFICGLNNQCSVAVDKQYFFHCSIFFSSFIRIRFSLGEPTVMRMQFFTCEERFRVITFFSIKWVYTASAFSISTSKKLASEG
jgi:histidinol dehydrogenase